MIQVLHMGSFARETRGERFWESSAPFVLQFPVSPFVYDRHVVAVPLSSIPLQMENFRAVCS